MFAAQGCGLEMRADSLMSWHEVKLPFAHFLRDWCGVQDFNTRLLFLPNISLTSISHMQI